MHEIGIIITHSCAPSTLLVYHFGQIHLDSSAMRDGTGDLYSLLVFPMFPVKVGRVFFVQDRWDSAVIML